MSSGLVLSIETNWYSTSTARGGNLIWIYDPLLNGLFYYAHNSSIFVSAGQWVNSGEKIAEVGRTGFNANKARSPTHLHLMFLKIQPSGQPIPLNPYTWLTESNISK